MRHSSNMGSGSPREKAAGRWSGACAHAGGRGTAWPADYGANAAVYGISGWRCANRKAARNRPISGQTASTRPGSEPDSH